MPRPRTGQARYRNGRWYARVSLGNGQRPTYPLGYTKKSDEARAKERALVLSELATKLAAADALDMASQVLTAAAVAEGERLAEVKRLVAAVEAGKAVREHDPEGMTFEELATMWTSGELAKRFPDHVKLKRTANDDVLMARKYIYPLVGKVPVLSFKLDHAERVMAAIPSSLSRATRRHVGQIMHRVLSLAVFPMRIREANPLPRGWLPKLGAKKAKAWLYPDEDARLLGCVSVPLPYRLLYGFLAREGMRKSEALSLTWGDIDLARGAVSLDANKTDDPRTWALDPGVAEALRRWHLLCGCPHVGAPVFIDVSNDAPVANVRAELLRAHLRGAGVERRQLFDRTANRDPINVHGLRRTFVTLALANGRSEAWVQDRTGHRSSVMINRYRRAARSVTELGLGWLAPLCDAIPELKGPPMGPDRKGAESGDYSASFETPVIFSGESGIRTRGGRKPSPDFESGASGCRAQTHTGAKPPGLRQPLVRGQQVGLTTGSPRLGLRVLGRPPSNGSQPSKRWPVA